MAHRLFASICILFVAASAFGATFIVPDDREMVRRTTAIVVGRALTSYTQPTAEGGIETVTPFEVGEVIKGKGFSSVVLIYEPGGEYGDRAQIIDGVPRFFSGEEAIVFLTPTGPDRWSVTDIALGKFTIDRQIVARTDSDINGWGPDLMPHREPKRSLQKFLEFLRTEANGGMGRTDYIVPQSKLQATSDVFRAATNVTATSYTMDLASGRGGRWNVFPNQVTFYLAPIAGGQGSASEPGAPGGGTTAASMAMATWDNDPNSNVNYQLSGGAAPCGGSCQGLKAPDSVNTISFEVDMNSRWGIPPFTCSGSSYGGTLGLGGITSTNGTHAGPNNETFYSVNEGDAEMNRGIANCTVLFNNGDFNTAVAHEVGHTLGFRHSDQIRTSGSSTACTTDPSLECSSVAVMKSFVPSGINAALQAWDQHAVRAVYPGTTSNPPPTPQAFTPAARHAVDFDNDAKDDILWRNQSNGTNYGYLMSGTAIKSQNTINTADLVWIVAGKGDFNGDGRGDILFRNTQNGQNYMYFMSGLSIIGQGSVPAVDVVWDAAGVGDFDGDGRADILWRNRQTGQNWMYLMSGNTIKAQGAVITTDLVWGVAGIGDLNGDARSDIVWRNTSTGMVVVYFMNGMTVTSQPTIATVDLSWQIAAIGDFNGDLKSDIYWRQSTGTNYVYIMNGSAIAQQGTNSVADSTWSVVSVGDFNGDGRDDIFWRNTNGTNYVYLMNGIAKIGEGTVSVADTVWRVQ